VSVSTRVLSQLSILILKEEGLGGVVIQIQDQEIRAFGPCSGIKLAVYILEDDDVEGAMIVIICGEHADLPLIIAVLDTVDDAITSRTVSN